MRARTSLACVCTTLVLVCACGTALPAMRPPDFAIERTTRGGMSHEAESFRCTRRGCVEATSIAGDDSEVDYEVTVEQLDSLYAALREHAFDLIDVRTMEEASDRGGTRVRVQAAGHSYDVADAGSRFVEDVRQFRAVLTAIASLQAELRARHASVPVVD